MTTMPFADAANDVWDVAVVGAGPAGSMAAYLLARQGVRTLLVDRASFPRFKVCGCCLNRAALTILDRADLSDTTSLGRPIANLVLRVRGRQADIPLPTGRVISRELWDDRLMRRAVAAGVQFHSATTAALEAEMSTQWRLLTLRQGDYRIGVKARIVLAADGLAGGLLQRDDASATRVEARSRIGAGTIVDGNQSGYTSGSIFMAVGRGGYVGVVRLEDGRLDLAAALDAAAVTRAGGLGSLATEIMRDAGACPLPVEHAQWKGTPTLTRRRVRPGGFRAFALGDAVGYVEPFTGEGIAWALASAEAVVPLVRGALQRWDDRMVDRWKRAYRQQIGRRQWMCRLLGQALRSPGLIAAAVAVGGVCPSLFQPFARFVNRLGPVA